MNGPGQRIGRYELLELLGSGGMADVFRARLSGPGRASKPVALKLIRPQLANDGQFVLMFLDELRIAMALSHRNIVQTFDGGEADGHYFLAMELVNGPSLASLLKELEPHAPVPADLALFIAAEICAALDHAHGYESEDPEQPTGVMHRDVSPGNILLSEQGDVKLTDFGVAKATGRIMETRTDLVKGKLTYMAPEQARGTVTPVSDLYSLGAVLYEMLTRRPIRRTATLEEARRGHLQVPSLRKLRPELPAALEEVVMQCLAADPTRRPITARALLQFLSQESRQMPLEEGQPLDPRMRLQAFLVREEGPELQPDRQDRAKRLAQAMIFEAEDVPEDSALQRGRSPTLPDMGGAFGFSEPPSLDDSEPPPLDFEEQEDSEALPLTSLIAPEAPVERASRGRMALIAGAVGVALAVALVWLWQDSAPVQDRRLATRSIPGGEADRGGGSAPRDAALTSAPTPASAPVPALAPTPATAPVPALAPVPVPVPAPNVSAAPPVPAPKVSAAPPVPAPKVTAAPPVKTRRRVPRRAPAQPGTLSLNTDPWAKVYVDGKYRGETPLQGLRLSPGRHKVYLHNPKRALSARVTVQIRSGKDQVKVIKLAPQ